MFVEQYSFFGTLVPGTTPMSSKLTLLLALFPALFSTSDQLYSQPVIGILTFPNEVDNPPFSSFFDNSYKQWLEQVS
jgi:hypothetical protein